MQSIRHENVIEIQAAAEVGGFTRPMKVIEIITPYYELGSISDYLLSGSRFAPSAALAVCKSALLGLEELHEVHGLCHRDIKSGNILLRNLSTGVVADLGLAGPMNESGSVIALDTPTLYSAPELQVVGELTRASDLFSMGLVLVELLGGNFDYGSYSREDVVVALTKGRSPVRADDLSLPVWAPSDLRRIVRKATQRTPSGRFQTARAFYTALSKVKIVDWVEVQPLVWTAAKRRFSVQVDLMPAAGVFDASIRIDRGRGPRRLQAPVRVASVRDPALARLFDQANRM